MKLSEVIKRLSSDNSQVNRKEIVSWLNNVSPERDLISVETVKVGDTFWHNLVGGKNRPWVVLWVRKGMVGAATLTHSELPGGFECKDRFWVGNFIGPTTCVFTVDRVKGFVYYPYTNLKHLAEVRREISNRWK